jgi:hypothetical protein
VQLAVLSDLINRSLHYTSHKVQAQAWIPDVMPVAD